MYGLGSWAAVGEHVGTKGEGACRAHYYEAYIDTPTFPEPRPLPCMAGVDSAQVGRAAVRGPS